MQLLLSNTINSICKLWNGFKYCNEIPIVQFNINHLFASGLMVSSTLNNEIVLSNSWRRTLTGTTPQGQCKPVNNGNEGVLDILQSSESRTAPSDPV